VRTIHSEEKDTPAGISLEEIVDFLRKILIFSPLNTSEIRKLAENCELRTYADDEPITIEGQKGESMFVIYQGKAKVQVIDNGIPKTLAELKEGDFFGEMGLFTGQPRTASVISEEETKVFRIKKSAIKPLLDENPDLVQAFGKIIAERQAELEKLSNKQDTSDEKDLKDKSSNLVKAIRNFFGLT
jgi:CRP-like cAMP-binding protein